MAMTMYHQLDSFKLNKDVIIIPCLVAGRICGCSCLGIVSHQCEGGHCFFYLLATGCQTGCVFTARNSQSRMVEWSFLLVLTCHWLVEERPGVHIYILSKSDTNVELDVSLSLLGCSNWKYNYHHSICGIFDVRMAFDHHCYFNLPSASILWHCDHH